MSAPLRVEWVAPNTEKQLDISPYKTIFSTAENFASTELLRLKFSMPGVCPRLTFPFFKCQQEKVSGFWEQD